MQCCSFTFWPRKWSKICTHCRLQHSSEEPQADTHQNHHCCHERGDDEIPGLHAVRLPAWLHGGLEPVAHSSQRQNGWPDRSRNTRKESGSG